MMNRIAAVALLTLPLCAQTPPQPVDRTPSVSYTTGALGIYKPGAVSSTDPHDSPRLRDLVRDGQIHLSLQDAIALALENNLDIELERYSIPIAATDTLRAKGGGLLRGVPLTANEAPAGLGGPGEPLLNTAATGSTPQTTTVTSVVTDTQFINEVQDNLSTTGPFAFSIGPNIPQFDPALTGQFLAQHLTTLEINPLNYGTPALVNNTVAANAGYTQGFGPGTQLQASFQNLYNNGNSNQNTINPYWNSSLGVTVTQPLLRGFGIAMNRRFIRIAQNNQRMSDQVFRYQANITVSGIVRLYTDLVSLSEDLKVKQETLATAQRLAEDNRNKVDQGTLAPVEVTRAQAQVAAAQQDVANADGYLREQELILKSVITRDFSADPVIHDARIVPTDPLPLDPLPTDTLDHMVQTAFQSRPDYIAAKTQLENTQITLEGSRNNVRPELDLVGYMANNGLAGALNPTYGSPSTLALSGLSVAGAGDGYGSALAQVLARDYPTYSIGLNLTLPLRNRVAQADLARDELQLKQTQVRTKQLENTIRVQVEDALIALRRSRAAYDAAVETRRLQEQSLEIEQERFDVGLSTNFLVIQYQSYVAQARSTEVAARGAYAKSWTQLDSVMGTILQVHNITLEDAYKGRADHVSGPAVPGKRP
ncbi:MAG: TolC family protein [Bryobacteraceae bacterium]|jgi:outer membrane protein TolC